MKRVLASLDFETVPDIALAKHFAPDLTEDGDLYQWIHDNVSTNGFPKIMFHKVIAASIAIWSREEGFEVLSFKGADDECAILTAVANVFEDCGGSSQLQLITFNGINFDLQVLRQRAMHHGISLKAYWDQGETNADAKWDNYINRFHRSHCDLLQVVTGFSSDPAVRMTLAQLSILSGLGGKLGAGAESVKDAFLVGDIEGISQYCDIDALITFLIFLRLEQTRGTATERKIRHIVEDVAEWCLMSDRHSLISDFMSQWHYDSWIQG